MIRDYSSTSRALFSRNNELSFDNNGRDIPRISKSRRHYLRDDKLDSRYSTTHQKIRGQFSLILNDEDNIDGSQHKGILRVSSDKLGRWMKIRHTPNDSVFLVGGEIIHKVGTEYSKFVDDMRLVIDANHTILPSWKVNNNSHNNDHQNNNNNNNTNSNNNNNNEHICHVLRVMTNRIDLTLIPDGGIPPIVLNVTADCIALDESMDGQGNTILALYGLRLISALAKVDFEFQCYSNNSGYNNNNNNKSRKEKARKLRWVFPWFASYQSATTSEQPWPYSGNEPTQEEACSTNLDSMPLDKMADQIRNDVRKMAVQLIGPRIDSSRIHPLVPLDVDPWIPNITVDDVIIHFPCHNDVYDNKILIGREVDYDQNGERGGRINNNPISIMHFTEYTKRISKNVKSIGIITEISTNERRLFNETNDWCHNGSEILLRYLKEFYASQSISISIYDNDALPLQYARIAMAKQSFSSFSTFGMIPIIGAFGEGYFLPTVGDDSQNIIQNIISGKYEGFDNIHLMDTNNILSPKQLSSMDFDSISELLTVMESNSNEKDALDENSDVKNATNVSSNLNNMLVWNEEMYQTIQVKGYLPDSSRMIRVDNETGYINKNGQLVVDVNETVLFWHNGQEKLCNILQNMTLASSLEATAPVPSTVLNVTMDCIDQNTEKKQGLGQGNWVTAIYASRMAAYLAGVDFKFQCLDGQNSKMNLLLPWFDRHQVANPINRTIWPYGGERPNTKEACTVKYPHLRIDKMALQIQDDLRKMAVTLLGTRDEIRQHPDVPVDAEPLIPNIQLDDVALHFRCGDVLGGANRNDFGMIRYNEYKKWIPKDTESIGILTQPFEKERNRGRDSGKTENCRTVVFALVEYLQDFAPKAKITIHNGSNETLPLAYARLVMANYAITSLTSFGIFPIVGTFGQGFFQEGNRGVNPFATYIPSILDNIHEMNANVRTTAQMKGKSVEDLVEWFVENPETNPVY